jgi:hypothetical protein
MALFAAGPARKGQNEFPSDISGGEGIRTPGTRKGTAVFKTHNKMRFLGPKTRLRRVRVSPPVSLRPSSCCERISEDVRVQSPAPSSWRRLCWTNVGRKFMRSGSCGPQRGRIRTQSIAPLNWPSRS